LRINFLEEASFEEKNYTRRKLEQKAFRLKSP